MSAPKAIVIGASRGIGKGIVAELEKSGYDTYRTVRSEVPGDDDHTFQVDLNDVDGASVRAAAAKVDSLDVLVVSGAVASAPPYLDISGADHHAIYQTNVVGPLAAAQAFLPALRRGKQKTIVFISSAVADAGFNASNVRQPREKRMALTRGPYAATKAALNLLGIGLYDELLDEGFSVLLVHPGLVRTDMAAGAIKALEDKFLNPDEVPVKAITVDESVAGIAKVVRDHIAAGKPDVRFVNYDGSSAGF